MTPLDVRSLHRLVMLRSAPGLAGRYADQGRYVLERFQPDWIRSTGLKTNGAENALGYCLHEQFYRRAVATQGDIALTDRGRRSFPSPAEVPALIDDFSAWLGVAAPTPERAFTAHRRLAEIHPFDGGNGRTARLLMNLILLRGGYPPVAVRPADRPAYISALQQAQAGGSAAAFDRLLCEKLDATLQAYIAATLQARAAAGDT